MNFEIFTMVATQVLVNPRLQKKMWVDKDFILFYFIFKIN